MPAVEQVAVCSEQVANTAVACSEQIVQFGLQVDDCQSVEQVVVSFEQVANTAVACSEQIVQFVVCSERAVRVVQADDCSAEKQNGSGLQVDDCQSVEHFVVLIARQTAVACLKTDVSYFVTPHQNSAGGYWT